MGIKYRMRKEKPIENSVIAPKKHFSILEKGNRSSYNE